MTRMLDRVLHATGYIEVGPEGSIRAPGLVQTADGVTPRLEPAFSKAAGLQVDAVYQAAEGPMILIKDAGERMPSEAELSDWHERAWNLGLAPLLWIVTPVEVRVYDAYSGIGPTNASTTLSSYRTDVVDELQRLEALCGRAAVESGAFWSSEEAARIHRDKRVDKLLLNEIGALEEELLLAGRSASSTTVPDADESIATIGSGPPHADASEPNDEGGKSKARRKPVDGAARDQAQALVTCTLFAAYLFERGTPLKDFPVDLPTDLPELLASPVMSRRLFAWLHKTFNGDVFPEGVGSDATEEQLVLLSRFAAAESLVKRTAGQYRLFRFRFDAIPIELISSVYEAFARRSAGEQAKKQGLHYTPIELVHMALDPIFDGLPHDAKFLDPTCGSGVFLVQVLRRLVLRRRRSHPDETVDVRGILYKQIHGVDLNGAALRIAAFSLYLAVLELETDQAVGGTSKFRTLIGSNLVEEDFLAPSSENRLTKVGINVVVGNPPWTHVSGRKTAGRKDPFARRATDQDFTAAVLRIVGQSGRLSLFLKASPFFSRDGAAVGARNRILDGIERLALIDLSGLRTERLFPGAKGPAILLCANCGHLPPKGEMLIGSVPWSPDFRRSGMIAWGAADAKSVVKKEVLTGSSTLKAMMKGTPRDADLLRKLDSDRFTTLEVLLDRANAVHRGQGWQNKGKKTKPIDPSIAALPVLKPDDYRAGGISVGALPSFEDLGITKLLFQRDRSIYSAPILIIPKSAHRHALEQGRLSAIILQEDVAYSESFYGVSFAGRDASLATLLAIVINSAVASFQMLFEAAGLGSERPTVGPADVLAMRVPMLDPSVAPVEAAADLLRRGDITGIDDLAYDLYGLSSEERMIVSDSVERGRSTFLDTRAARFKDVETPSEGLLRRYANATCATVNRLLRFSGRQHMVAELMRTYRSGEGLAVGFAAVRFHMRPGPPPRRGAVVVDAVSDHPILEDVRGHLHRNTLPYLSERRSLRIYGKGDVTVVKPAQRRYWSVAAALQDGDSILADHWFAGAS